MDPNPILTVCFTFVFQADKNYEISHDIRGQLRCLEELDKVERKRHDEMERELLLRAAKSRSKSEDPEQVKLKAKAKEVNCMSMEAIVLALSNWSC